VPRRHDDALGADADRVVRGVFVGKGNGLLQWRHVPCGHDAFENEALLARGDDGKRSANELRAPWENGNVLLLDVLRKRKQPGTDDGCDFRAATASESFRTT